LPLIRGTRSAAALLSSPRIHPHLQLSASMSTDLKRPEHQPPTTWRSHVLQNDIRLAGTSRLMHLPVPPVDRTGDRRVARIHSRSVHAQPHRRIRKLGGVIVVSATARLVDSVADTAHGFTFGNRVLAGSTTTVCIPLQLPRSMRQRLWHDRSSVKRASFAGKRTHRRIARPQAS
jgi:hypothetical protein